MFNGMKNDKKKPQFVNQPQYPGGPKEMTKFIYSNLRYPQGALAAGVEGTVMIEYDIDYQGNVVASRILQGLGHGCDEEAARIVRLFKFDVAKQRGLHVLFHQKAKIQFKKPVPVPVPVPEPAPGTLQLNYSYTTAAPVVDAASNAAPKETTYSYTVTIG